MGWKKNFLFNIAFAITCLLIFLLIVEESLLIPTWLQVFGRAHPLFLHIPIGLFLLVCIAEFFSIPKISKAGIRIRDVLLEVTAVSASLTALMGLFLSKESGYDLETLLFHKWAGIATCVILVAWYQWRNQFRKRPIINKGVAVLGVFSIIIAGHGGGNITHGEDFVLAPLMQNSSEPVAVAFDSAKVYDHMVRPILEAKCVTCHNESKAKGELVMESPEWLIKGGKSGKLWDTTTVDMGLFSRRIHLPVDDKKRMPPRGKPQLTEDEFVILDEWVKSGSSFVSRVAELKPDEPLLGIASAIFSKENNDRFDFEPADESTVKSLNNFYRIVTPVAENSPALSVGFFGASKFNPQSLGELAPVKDKIVQLNLSRMPIEDKDLQNISGFANLRKLNLSFTGVKGDGLSNLKSLEHLREISLTGTSIDTSALNRLLQFPSLRKVFLWSTKIPPSAIKTLSAQNSKIDFETGFFGDTLVLKLTPPMLQHKYLVATEPFKLKLKHNINGAEIRYTLDGTDPDSIKSPLYKNDLTIDKDAVLKTKAFRTGWISSDIQTSSIFISRIKPKSIELVTPPHNVFKGDGSVTLGDYLLTLPGLNMGRWLGYDKELDVLMTLDENTRPEKVSVSFINWHDYNAFLPESVSIWCGNDPDKLEKLNTIQPVPATKKQPIENISLSFDLPDRECKYIRIKAKPIKKVPVWQDKKQPSGWMFVDEIVIK